MKTLILFIICMFYTASYQNVPAQNVETISLTAQTDSTDYMKNSMYMQVSLRNQGDIPVYFFGCCLIKHSSQKKNDRNEWGKSEPIFCTALCGNDNIELDTNSTIIHITSPPHEVGVYRYIFLFTIDSANTQNYDSLYTNEFVVYEITTGINFHDINYLNEFFVSQNYPNPFNPTTKIEYSIPMNPPSSPFTKGGSGESRGEFLTLKVYDVLGNKIAMLINENKTTGNYEVNFDGSNLPSGVYLYQLQAGEFVQTKKMILLR